MAQRGKLPRDAIARQRAIARYAETQARRTEEEPSSFENFSASALFCPKCQAAMPVRETLLLVLPSGNVYDYRCAQCGTSVGTKR